MNKKKRVIILTVIVIFLALIFLSLLFIKLKPGLLTGPGNNQVGDRYTEANLDNIVTPEIDGPMIPVRVIDSSKSEIEKSETKIIKEKEAELLGDSALQQEQIIVVTESGFSPKQINVIHNTKVPLILRALDDKNHQINLELEENIVKLDFSKSTGDLNYLFMGPEPGSYDFYIDNEENKGVMVSVEK